MNKYLIIKSYIKNSKLAKNELLTENIRLSTQLKEADEQIISLKKVINEYQSEINDLKVKYGLIGVGIGFGVGKI